MIEYSLRDSTETDIAMDFRENGIDDIPFSHLLIAIKGFDLGFLEEKFHRSKTGVSLGMPEEIPRSIGRISCLPLLEGMDHINARYLNQTSLIDFISQEPRDFTKYQDGYYVLVDGFLLQTDRKGDVTNKYPHPYLHEPHSIFPDKTGRYFVITASGCDSLVVFDAEEKNFQVKWTGYDNGYNYSIGSDHKVLFSDGVSVDGSQLGDVLPNINMERDNPRPLTTGQQTTHINSACFAADNQTIYATLFATHVENTDSGGIIGHSGGKLLAISPDGSTKEILKELSNPHSITPLGNDTYALANTSEGKIYFYEANPVNHDFKRVNVLSFRNLPGNLRGGKEWIQSFKISYDDPGKMWMTVADGARHCIHILNLNDRTRYRLHHPDQWAVQNVQVITNTPQG